MILHYAPRTPSGRSPPTGGCCSGRTGLRRPPHRRVAGSAARAPRPLRAREKLPSAEEAIARLTARAADRFGLDDRGRIEAGKRGDLVLLDPAAYMDTATYEDPLRLADGVTGVWVAGERAWADGAPTGVRAGEVKPVRRDEMPSIGPSARSRGMDVLPLRGR